MLKYFLIAAMLQIIWSLTPSASNLVIQYFPVELYTAIRWTFSGLIFTFFVIKKNGNFIVPRVHLLALFSLGILGYGVGSLGKLYGLKVGGVVNFALVGSISPLVTAAVAVMVLKEKVSKRFLFAALVSIFGVFTLVLGKYQLSNFQVAATSTFLIFGAYVLEALPFAYSKKLKGSVPLLHYLAVLQLSAALLSGDVGFGIEPHSTAPPKK